MNSLPKKYFPNTNVNKDTSWNKSAQWYTNLVGEKGHYYHQSVVIPGVIKLLELKANSSVLDLACGQGILGRSLVSFKDSKYLGVDGSEFLIKDAIKLDKNPNHSYRQFNLSTQLKLTEKFTHSTIILALQNIKNFENVLRTAFENLEEKGVLVLVINHPSFRIPRHSSWEFVEKSNVQYRKISRYMSSMEIPVDVNPSLGSNSSVAISFHFPMTVLAKALKNTGFMIQDIEEWVSDKTSFGSKAKIENTSRIEIPLFMALKCRKISL